MNNNEFTLSFTVSLLCSILQAPILIHLQILQTDLHIFLYLKTLYDSLNFIRLLRVVITPSVTLLRGENDSKQSDEFQATLYDSSKHFTFRDHFMNSPNLFS